MAKRICGIALVAALALSVSVSGQSLSSVEMVTPVTFAARQSSTTAVADLLSKRVESVDWVEETFEGVLDWLSEQGEGRVNVVPRWAALGVESVGPEFLVTLQLNNTTVAEVLSETLNQMSEDGQLAFHGVGNSLKISTREDFGRKMYVRVYDATDILVPTPNFGQNAPIIDLQNAGRSGGGGGGSGQSIFSGSGTGREQGSSGDQAEQRMGERLTELRELIEQVVAPETWDTAGGPGRIRVINRSLVITNTIEVHEMIAGPFSFNR